MRDLDTFRDDVIAAWLHQEDCVIKRGVPTWNILVRALKDRRLKQTGVAESIVADKINITE